ncbi:MAG: rhomboid family intramembrane serine protease [Gammaproteobacteria bacterium]|nr:rhomboid family intramembrane serine protease [Gammaproteobacteria bacterium]
MDSALQSANQLKAYLPLSLGFVGLLLAIQIINWMLGYRLNILGIWPRKMFGWVGIPFSPFLHGNFTHLLFNSLPVFIFSNLILLQGQTIFFNVSIYIILISGFLTWLFGRKGIHVGASALIMGYLGFIVIGVYHKPSAMSVIVGVVCIYYFSGMFSNLLPAQDKRVSWEGHVFGFLAGIVTAYLI